jgi:serine protease
MKRKLLRRSFRPLSLEDLETRTLMAADAGVAFSGLTDDKYEENDSFATAKKLGTLTAPKTITNLVLADTADWFSFTMKAPGAATDSVSLAFTHTNGDLDLKVYNTKGVEVRSATGVKNKEIVSLNGLPKGGYYVQVFGKNGAQNPKYSLTVDPPPAPVIDLVGQETLATNAASWGGTIAVQSQVYNNSLAATTSFQVQWYLSKDAIGSSDDVRLSLADGSTSYVHVALGPAAYGLRHNVSLRLPGTAPSGFASGSFYVLMKVDSANQIAETNEGNNFGQVGDFMDRDKIVVNYASPNFGGFDAFDASTDDSPNTVFNDGALRYNYSFNLANLGTMSMEAIGEGGVIRTLAYLPAEAVASGKLVNLAGVAGLPNGEYQLRLRASLMYSGATFYSALDTIRVIDDTWIVNGSYRGETSTYYGDPNTGRVYRMGGGTDTLNVNVSPSEVLSLNGLNLAFSIVADRQAIYKGSAYDYLRLTNGREIYFQGVERLKFSDGSIKELTVSPNDPLFNQQWNLHAMDVPSAWRFSQGSTGVMLVSLDSGVLNTANAPTWAGVHDLSRLMTDPTDDDNDIVNGIPQNYPYGLGHGHQAVSVMAGAANNGMGVAGVNTQSSVMVADVYNGVSLQQAIQDAINYARANGKRVVFQGGIQGDFWLTSGGTTSSLSSIISHNEDIAVFAIAAGNGGPEGNNPDSNYLNSVQGVAKYETWHYNVMSVGALQRTSTLVVDGKVNALSAEIAGYSNRGSNLTLMAPTDSLAMDKRGQAFSFGGTSCANPNLAGVASLVWSVNPALYGPGVRQVLVDTAYDLGASGDDNTYGNGLVNADAAVRRAYALAYAVDLASLYSGAQNFTTQSPLAGTVGTTTGTIGLAIAPAVETDALPAEAPEAVAMVAPNVADRSLNRDAEKPLAPFEDAGIIAANSPLANDVALSQWLSVSDEDAASHESYGDCMNGDSQNRDAAPPEAHDELFSDLGAQDLLAV